MLSPIRYGGCEGSPLAVIAPLRYAGETVGEEQRKTGANAMAESDTNHEASRQVNRVTDCEPVKGEDLVESSGLKRKYLELKR